MAMHSNWNPWHGCIKCSEGCQNCYVYYLDGMQGSCMFFGTFDGQGHTISNVTFHSDYPVCGVGVVGMNCGEVKNLTVRNVDIRCEDIYSMAVGGVVGYNMGIIHDVKVKQCIYKQAETFFANGDIA